MGPLAGLGGARRDRESDHRTRGQCGIFARRLKNLGGESGDRSAAQGGGWTPQPLFARRKGDFAMQSENKMFDDFVKMVNGMAGTFAGMGREAESSAREKMR